MRRILVPTITIMLLCLASTAWCGFTDAELDSLRKVGEQEGWTFTLGKNEGLMGTLQDRCGLKRPDNWAELATFDPCLPTAALPSSWDWRELDGVTPVKNQGGCGSCWAFSAVGALECAVRIKEGVTIDFSEQYLLSCNNLGYSCEGGWWAHAYHLHDSVAWHLEDECFGWGLVLEGNFPYAASDLPCGCPHPHEQDRCLANWGYVGLAGTTPTVEQLKQAIMQYGPISVAVLANDWWDNYTGGVLNLCPYLEPGDINHAVVLVGWEDNHDVPHWILKNSWGPGWGEGGYMRLAYNCLNIGYNASYVDYNLPKVVFWADSTVGWVPHEVNFEAFSLLSVDSWSWDFGDGQTASVETPPPHTYTERGTYDITVEITVGAETHTVTKNMYIIAVADTLKAGDIYGEPGEQVEVTLTATNTAPVQYVKIPFEFGGGVPVVYDSFSTAGCRTDYFEIQEYLHYDPWGQRNTLKLVSSNTGTSPELAPGTGAVAKLYFTIHGSATEGQSLTLQLDGYDDYKPAYVGSKASYDIAWIDGSITAQCCLNRGDINHDGGLDIQDVSYIVDWSFAGGEAPPCGSEADVDGNGPVNIEDLVYLVDHIYGTGPAPAPCQ